MLKKMAQFYLSAYRGLPRAAWLLALVTFVNCSGAMVLFFISLYVTRHLGGTLLQAGQVVAAYGFGALGGAWFGGWLVDRIGVRRVQWLSLFAMGSFCLAMSLPRSLGPLTALMVLFGLSAAALHPANGTAMAQVCPGELRLRGFALNRLAANLGVSIGPVVGGFLVAVDYRLLFWADGLTSWAAAALFTWLVHRAALPPAPPASPLGEADRAARSPWRDRLFLFMMAMVFLIGVIFIQVFTAFPTYVRSVWGMAESSIGLLLAVNTVMIALFEMPLLRALERLGQPRLVAIGALFLGGGFALMPLGRGAAFAALTVVVWTIGEMLAMPATSALVAERADEASRGRYMGVFSLAFALANMAGPNLGARVYARIGADVLWYACGAAGLLVSAGFLWLGRRRAAAAGDARTGAETLPR